MDHEVSFRMGGEDMETPNERRLYSIACGHLLFVDLLLIGSMIASITGEIGLGIILLGIAFVDFKLQYHFVYLKLKTEFLNRVDPTKDIQDYD